jgi:4-hydroxy-4-methyl-2-oxoglutarate aldolase
VSDQASSGPVDPDPAGIVRRLANLDVCAVCDALDACGIAGYVGSLLPMWEGARVVGRAVTVKLVAGPPPDGVPRIHLGARAIEAAQPGDVIVVDNDGREGMGSWGGLLALAASLQGVAGVITDGACRDVDEARDMRFPVFARRAAALTARGRVHESSCNEQVTLAGVRVRPADIVMGDGSGVVVIPACDVGRVVEQAEQIARREAAMAARLRDGASVGKVLGESYEDMLK